MKPQDEFLLKALRAAKDAQHIWPEYAACEAALESAWGTSKLATTANNLFGMKQHQHPVWETLSLPTREFLHNEWLTVTAQWVKYPDWKACFEDRMDTLHRMEVYSDALHAPDGKSFVQLVSQHWSTDPHRADKVLEIFHAHQGVLNGT